MKSKFEEFNDGIVAVYSENDDGKLVRKMQEDLRFGEENVSIQRHYSASAADQRVDKVIHVPFMKIFAAHDIVVIEDEQFDVEKIDNFPKSQPPITKLSLTLLAKHRKKEFA